MHYRNLIVDVKTALIGTAPTAADAHRPQPVCEHVQTLFVWFWQKTVPKNAQLPKNSHAIKGGFRCTSVVLRL
jgi:hypothetical protein